MQTKFPVLFVLVAAVAWPQLVIDNFTTGTYTADISTTGVVPGLTSLPAGSMFGAYRGTSFWITSNPFAIPGTFRIQAASGRAVVATGPKSGHRLDLVYGLDARRNIAPLNLNLSAYDRFRVNLAHSDLQTNVLMLVFTGTAWSSATLDIAPTSVPMSVDIPFSSFAPAPGAPAASFGDIDWLWFIFLPNNQFLSCDFVLTSLQVASGPIASGQGSPGLRERMVVAGDKTHAAMLFRAGHGPAPPMSSRACKLTWRRARPAA